MLRPEKMARVSVTGSRGVMPEVIETVHDTRLLHLTGYAGDWEGFDQGSPIEGADEASERLVTVRSLESILGVTEEDAGPARLVTDEALDEELEEIRTEVNELDDRRDELRDELRTVQESIERLRPFATLGIDLDLLRGYDSISVAVGTGSTDAVESELAEHQVTFDVFSEDDVVAVFARTDDLDDILVGTAFQPVERPDASGSPEEYLGELEAERQSLESKLSTVEDELEDLRKEVGAFLLAAEETLSIEVQQQEAPLDFATTDNAFVAEGWVPYEQYVELYEALDQEVGEHVDVDLVEIAEYEGPNTVRPREDVGGAPGVGEPTATDGGEVATDGGAVNTPMRNDSPPVIQNNPGAVGFFESIVQVINRPRYSELDPTIILFLTFPFFFGLMIGDLGYGILYMGIGYFLYSSFDSDVIRSLGGVGMLAGLFTAIFGVLYGEFFGLHFLGELVWPSGSPPLHKGLQPHYIEFAQLWLVLSLVFGLLHLFIGYVFDFYAKLDHGFSHALFESGSWIIMMLGLWVWVLADAPPSGAAPGILVGPESAFANFLGFAGFPTVVGFVGLAAFFVGLVMLIRAEPIEAVEFLNVLVNVLSYTRLAAVLLAKAGMAFVVNLLVFGAYAHDGEWHFIFTSGHSVAWAREQGYEIVFSGLMNAEGGVGLALGIVFGIVILVIGHALVLVLGITSAGLQAVRLEYVEFFGKFFEGGGDAYEPFGSERRYTTDD